MSEYIKNGLSLTWLVVVLYWSISSFSVKKVEQQESFSKRFLFYWLPLLIAILLLGPGEWFGHSLIRENFVPHTNLVGGVGLSISVIGAFIACWSRYKLGNNWSLSVQKKENHELITGFLLLFTGNCIIVGDYRGIIAVLIVFFSFWFKIKKEEKLLIETFGEKYSDYKKQTKALIPFLI